MIRQQQNNDFKIVLFGDSQVRNIDEIKWLQQSSVTAAMAENAQYGVSVGDIIYDELSLFPQLIQGITASKLDWHFLPGNHDINFDAETQKASDDIYNKYLDPSYYRFNYANFISLFDVMYDGNKKYHGELGKDQLEFIKNDLKFVDKNIFIVLMMHIPMDDIKDREQLFELLEGRELHFNFQDILIPINKFSSAKADGSKNNKEHHLVIAGATCGSWWNGAFDNFGIPMSFMRCGSPKGNGL